MLRILHSRVSTFSTGMKPRSHPSETSSTRPQLLFHALPGFVLLFLEEEEVDDETDSGAINYPKGDEERVTSACRPGIYATGGRESVLASIVPLTIFPEFRSSNSRNAECPKNWRKMRVYGVVEWSRIFNSDSSPTRKRETDRRVCKRPC